MFSLQQNCKKLNIEDVLTEVDGNESDPKRREDFWANMARAFKLGNLGVDVVWASRYDLQGGSREDLKSIWDALGTIVDSEAGSSGFRVTQVPFDNSLPRIHLVWDSGTLLVWDSGLEKAKKEQ